MFEEKKKLRRLSPLQWALVLSILLHVLILLYRQRENIFSSHEHPDLDSSPVEVTEISPEMLKKLTQDKKKTAEEQMVETEKAPNEDIDPDTRFLSDHNQSAAEQMRAKSTDDFREKQGTGQNLDNKKTAQQMPPTANQTQTGEKPIELDGEEEAKDKKQAGVKRDWRSLSLQDLGIGGDGNPTAANDDHIDDVQTGERTILSTREFRYFSYYHRIKELLRQHWKPSVEVKLYKMWERGRAVNSEELITKVLVLLDQQGSIQKISRVTSSGVLELDDAAVEAFYKAGPFPNPPKGIVDSDGFVRIRWDFILQTESAPRIQFQTNGGPPR